MASELETLVEITKEMTNIICELKNDTAHFLTIQTESMIKMQNMMAHLINVMVVRNNDLSLTNNS
jgi:hypothetical protein